MSLTSLSRIAGKQPAAAPGGLPTARLEGVTAAEVYALFEKDTGMQGDRRPGQPAAPAT